MPSNAVRLSEVFQTKGRLNVTEASRGCSLHNVSTYCRISRRSPSFALLKLSFPPLSLADVHSARLDNAAPISSSTAAALAFLVYNVSMVTSREPSAVRKRRAHKQQLSYPSYFGMAAQVKLTSLHGLNGMFDCVFTCRLSKAVDLLRPVSGW